MTALTLNFVFKFLHILGLMLGAAAGFGSMAVARQARRGTPSSDLLALRPHFSKLALAGIALLWISGLALWLMRYDLANLGPAYSVKLGVALALLGVVLVIYRTNRRASAAGTPPPAWLPRLGMTTPVLTLLAMALGVWVFI